MISSKKIKIYSKHQGNIDDWARSVSKREYKVLSYEDWFLIEELIQNVIYQGQQYSIQNYNRLFETENPK